MATKSADALTLKDRLSRLNFVQAAKLLGENGSTLINQGGKFEIDPANVSLDDRRLVVKFEGATVGMRLSKGTRKRLKWKCSACSTTCEHAGAVFSMILEDKTLLGLAVPPPDDSVPLELLTEDQLIERMLTERQQRASEEKMTLKALTPNPARRIAWRYAAGNAGNHIAPARISRRTLSAPANTSCSRWPRPNASSRWLNVTRPINATAFPSIFSTERISSCAFCYPKRYRMPSPRLSPPSKTGTWTICMNSCGGFGKLKRLATP